MSSPLLTDELREQAWSLHARVQHDLEELRRGPQERAEEQTGRRENNLFPCGGGQPPCWRHRCVTGWRKREERAPVTRSFLGVSCCGSLWITTKCAAGPERQPKDSNHEASDGEDGVFFGFRVGLQEEDANTQQDDAT